MLRRQKKLVKVIRKKYHILQHINSQTEIEYREMLMPRDVLIIGKKAHEFRHHNIENRRQKAKRAKMLEKVTKRLTCHLKPLTIKTEGNIRVLTVLSYIGSSSAL